MRRVGTSRHDAVDRCSDGMRMMTVVVAVVRKIVEQRADERICSDGDGFGGGAGVGGNGGAAELEPSSASTGPYPRRRAC